MSLDRIQKAGGIALDGRPRTCQRGVEARGENWNDSPHGNQGKQQTRALRGTARKREQRTRRGWCDVSTRILTVDQLIESLENTKDDDNDDLYVVLGEPVGSDLDVTFDDREETAEIESTQGWAFGAFDDDMDAMALGREVSHFLFGSLLVEEQYLSEGAVEAAKGGGSE